LYASITRVIKQTSNYTGTSLLPTMYKNEPNILLSRKLVRIIKADFKAAGQLLIK